VLDGLTYEPELGQVKVRWPVASRSAPRRHVRTKYVSKNGTIREGESLSLGVGAARRINAEIIWDLLGSISVGSPRRRLSTLTTSVIDGASVTPERKASLPDRSKGDPTSVWREPW
jgi:hypothetical protein